MSLRRKGLWIAYGLLFVFHTVLLFSPPPSGEMVKGEVIAQREVWHVAGRFLLACNVFFPVVAGILSADRVRRDFRLGVRELQDSTPLSRPVYVLAKYLGSLRGEELLRPAKDSISWCIQGSTVPFEVNGLPVPGGFPHATTNARTPRSLSPDSPAGRGSARTGRYAL